MTKEEKIAFKKRLAEEIAQTEERIRELEGMTNPISPDDAIGRVSRMDAINNKSVADAALRTARRKLKKLNEALKKVNKTDFGICLSCKRPIQARRLMFMPQSTKCVRCAS